MLDPLAPGALIGLRLGRCVGQQMLTKPLTVFRGIGADPRAVIAGIKNDLVLWPSFSSTSNSRFVASGFMARSGKGGVIFKIKAKNCREIMQYSYKPMERELLLPPQTWFTVQGVYHATDYNLQYGLAEGTDGLHMESIAMVPMRARRTSEIQESEVVLVVMDEIDPTYL